MGVSCTSPSTSGSAQGSSLGNGIGHPDLSPWTVEHIASPMSDGPPTSKSDWGGIACLSPATKSLISMEAYETGLLNKAIQASALHACTEKHERPPTPPPKTPCSLSAVAPSLKKSKSAGSLQNTLQPMSGPPARPSLGNKSHSECAVDRDMLRESDSDDEEQCFAPLTYTPDPKSPKQFAPFTARRPTIVSLDVADDDQALGEPMKWYKGTTAQLAGVPSQAATDWLRRRAGLKPILLATPSLRTFRRVPDIRLPTQDVEADAAPRPAQRIPLQQKEEAAAVLDDRGSTISKIPAEEQTNSEPVSSTKTAVVRSRRLTKSFHRQSQLIQHSQSLSVGSVSLSNICLQNVALDAHMETTGHTSAQYENDTARCQLEKLRLAHLQKSFAQSLPCPFVAGKESLSLLPFLRGSPNQAQSFSTSLLDEIQKLMAGQESGNNVQSIQRPVAGAAAILSASAQPPFKVHQNPRHCLPNFLRSASISSALSLSSFPRPHTRPSLRRHLQARSEAISPSPSASRPRMVMSAASSSSEHKPQTRQNIPARAPLSAARVCMDHHGPLVDDSSLHFYRELNRPRSATRTMATAPSTASASDDRPLASVRPHSLTVGGLHTPLHWLSDADAANLARAAAPVAQADSHEGTIDEVVEVVTSCDEGCCADTFAKRSVGTTYERKPQSQVAAAAVAAGGYADVPEDIRTAAASSQLGLEVDDRFYVHPTAAAPDALNESVCRRPSAASSSSNSLTIEDIDGALEALHNVI